MSDDPIVIRNVVAGDIAYIYSTWLRDMRAADSGGLPDDLWFAAHRAWIDRVLADPEVVALIACAADYTTEILGYIVGRPGIALDWVHVRRGALRGQGIAKRLLEHTNMLDVPARWSTPDGRRRLKNPVRSRKLRGAPHG